MSGEEAVLRYESLRSRRGLHGLPSREGELFVQRGMAGWMHSWATCATAPCPAKSDVTRVDGGMEGLPWGPPEGLIGLITAMVMAAYGS